MGVSLGISADLARQLQKMQKSASAFSGLYEKQVSTAAKLSQQFLASSVSARLSQEFLASSASARLSQELLASSASARLSQELLASSASARLSQEFLSSLASARLSQERLASSVSASLSQHLASLKWKLPDKLSESLLSMNYPLNKMANRFYGRDLASVAFQQVMEITEDICSDAVENDELTEQARSANDEFQALVNGSLGLESLSDKSLRFLLWLLNGIILPIFAAAMGGIIATQYINDKALALGLAKNNREVKTLVRCYSNEEKMALSGCRVVLGDGIRVRATPGLKGNVIATLPVGKIVTILDSTQRAWLLIEADIDGETVEGWVSRRYTVPFR